MEKAYKEGLVVQQRSGAVPRYKRYLVEMKGNPLDTIWVNIQPIQAQSKERIGYPTQKPLALLERIVKAGSNECDILLDPFCGCATACVAADRLGRKWAGIDLSPLAAKLVHQRIQAEGPLLYELIHSFDIPKRTDVGELPPFKTHKRTLFGQQEGLCNGCRIAFPFQNFTVDHVVPQSKGGTHHIDNLQLLSNACNSKKGAGTQAELIVKLRQEGLIQRKQRRGPYDETFRPGAGEKVKNLEPIQTKGYFWLSENPEERLPGELRISEHGRIELDLMGLFPNARLSGGGDVNDLWGPLRDMERICGHVEDGGFVTLLDCMPTRFRANPFSIQALEFSSFCATFALIGADYEQDELTFRKLNFVMEGLDDWLSMDTIRTSVKVGVLDGKVNSFVGGQVEYGSQESPSYSLENGIRIQFFSSVRSSSLSQNLPLRFFSLTSQPYVSLTLNTPREIDYFINLAEKVRKFISLAVDQEVRMQSFTFIDEISDRVVPIRLYLPMIQTRTDDYKPSYGKILFTHSDVEERFAEVMNRWIDQYESNKAGHALNLYFAGAWEESSFLDSNLIFLAKAIEILHREVHPESRPIDRNQYKEWKRRILDSVPRDIPDFIKNRVSLNNQTYLRDRVLEMIEPFENWFRDNETSEEFAGRVSDTRNYFTHYSRKLKKDLRNSERLLNLYTKLEILLLLHILKLIGFDKCQIAQVVERSRRLKEALDTSS